jgi:ATP-dependent RNA helicase RhlE
VQFNELNLIDPLLRAVRDEGYDTPTPIQEQTIPHLLAGRDVLGCAQTGTGKTAAFALPILQALYATASAVTAPTQNTNASASTHGRAVKSARPSGSPPRVLILTPTRELAAQIGESFAIYGKYLPVRHAVIFGGVGQQPQVDKLQRGVDILVATPGRLLDLLNQRLLRLDRVEMFVLDEADRMLDMGFIHDVKKVLAVLPVERQNLLYSATMPPEIVELANGFLHDPVHIEVTPTATTVDKIDQHIFFVEKNDKRPLLEHLLREKSVKRVIVFTRTKHGANKLAKQLTESRINAEAIHGNKSQSAREAALAGFKAGKVRVLVATDIAARGIDVEGITHVINYDLPNIPESYVHRIGRTARAGAEGIAFSFCDEEERAYLRDIERAIRKHIPVVTTHPYPSPLGIPTPTDINRTNGRSAAAANAPRPSAKPRTSTTQPRRTTPNGNAAPPARSANSTPSTPRSFSPDDPAPRRASTNGTRAANGNPSSNANTNRSTGSGNGTRAANGNPSSNANTNRSTGSGNGTRAATGNPSSNANAPRSTGSGNETRAANGNPSSNANVNRSTGSGNGTRAANGNPSSNANGNGTRRTTTSNESRAPQREAVNTPRRQTNDPESRGNRDGARRTANTPSRPTREGDEPFSTYPELNGRGFRDDGANRGGMRDFASRSRQPERASAWNDSSDYGDDE